MCIFRKDPLLDYPLLTEDEIKSFKTEIEATQTGETRSIAQSAFWHRAMAESARRQALLARSVGRATWALVLSTIVLAIATVLQVFRH